MSLMTGVIVQALVKGKALTIVRSLVLKFTLKNFNQIM